jgi:hypothetical protein
MRPPASNFAPALTFSPVAADAKSFARSGLAAVIDPGLEQRNFAGGPGTAGACRWHLNAPAAVQATHDIGSVFLDVVVTRKIAKEFHVADVRIRKQWTNVLRETNGHVPFPPSSLNAKVIGSTSFYHQ